ncbi:hypothetical protein B0H14DRAFT_2818646, partial [Mycena olivaceomarginata]
MPCLALLLACGAAALTAPAAPATRSPRRPAHTCAALAVFARPIVPPPAPYAASVCASPHPAPMPRLPPAPRALPASRGSQRPPLRAHALRPRFPPAHHVVAAPTYSRPRFTVVRTAPPHPGPSPALRAPLGPRAFVRILRRFAPALYFRARASLRHPPHVCACGSPQRPRSRLASLRP